MKITKIASSHEVELSSQSVGCCWEFSHPCGASPVLGMTVARNGHVFYLNLETGREMCIKPTSRVVPVNVSLQYSEK